MSRRTPIHIIAFLGFIEWAFGPKFRKVAAAILE